VRGAGGWRIALQWMRAARHAHPRSRSAPCCARRQTLTRRQTTQNGKCCWYHTMYSRSAVDRHILLGFMACKPCSSAGALKRFPTACAAELLTGMHCCMCASMLCLCYCSWPWADFGVQPEVKAPRASPAKRPAPMVKAAATKVPPLCHLNVQSKVLLNYAQLVDSSGKQAKTAS
jgi:hypothetical protein